MVVNWMHAWPSAVAAFLASIVEFVEALTVILAVGTVRGWRSALGGAGAAAVVLAAMVAVLGPALTRIPLGTVQLLVGALLLLFGLRWLRKAILRSADLTSKLGHLAQQLLEGDLAHSLRSDGRINEEG